MLVRFIAAALISWTAVELALYLVISRHNDTPVSYVACAVRSLPLLLGLIILIKSKTLAQWVADKLDL